MYWSRPQIPATNISRASTFSHVRLFSFTDDAIDVDLPGSPTLLIFRDIDMKANAGQDGDGYFILLIKFRQVTSQHYQKLFGSRRDTLNEPWFNRLQDIVGLQTAYDALTIDSTPSQKDVLGLELHYLIILLLLPLETRTSLDSYGTCLLFDSSISYSRILSRLIQEDRNFMICCTSLEFLRATRVVRYLMSMLRDQSCHIFEETALRKPPSIVDTQLPTVIERSLIESVSAVVGFCAEMKHTLETLQRRFGQWLNYRELMEELGANLQAFRIRERSYQWQPSQENQRDCQPEEQRYDHNSWQLYQEPPHHYGL